MELIKVRYDSIEPTHKIWAATNVQKKGEPLTVNKVEKVGKNCIGLHLENNDIFYGYEYALINKVVE